MSDIKTLTQLSDQDDPIFGKDVIESLTLGMYENSYFIFREYIQNSADAIDKAVKMGIMKYGEEDIYVTISPEKKIISIEDNGTGVQSEKAMQVLRSIARSTKVRGEDKGFRGIGRLGGLGYCTKLVFETSYYGEAQKSVMTWDAAKLKAIINDRKNTDDAATVLKQVTKIDFGDELPEKHYFKVVLENVTDPELLEVASIRDYLSMVAPVDINASFLFRSKIRRFMADNDLHVDIYNIFVNSDQIYKPYTNYIFEDNNGGKKKVGEIMDVEFLLKKDSLGNVLYWGWYSLSELAGQMKPKNLARGIRLRKENIQIGDEEICKKFFSKTEDQRFSFYYFGELHASNKELIPNSRRDYFCDNETCKDFERLIKIDFLKLKELCYQVQKLRTQIKAENTVEQIRETIKEKGTSGYTSQKEKDDLEKKLNDAVQKLKDARRQADRVREQVVGTDSPLNKTTIINKIMPPKEVEIIDNVSHLDEGVHIVEEKRTLYRTDNAIYSSFDRKEKKIIREIYSCIENAWPDKKQVEQIISIIEQQLTSKKNKQR